MNAPVRTVTKEDNLRPLITLDGLSDDFKHLDSLVADLEKRAKAVPPVLEDDEDLEVLNAIFPDLNAGAKKIETARVDTKKPFDDAGKIVQNFFKALDGRLETEKGRLQKVGKIYLDKKAAAERKRREQEEAEARRKAQEAADAARAAVKAGDIETATMAVVEAQKLEQVAERATSATTVNSADLARTSVGGVTSTLRESWTFSDLNMNEIDLEVLRPFITTTAIEQALRQFIKSGRHEIKGARIFKDTQFTAR